MPAKQVLEELARAYLESEQARIGLPQERAFIQKSGDEHLVKQAELAKAAQDYGFAPANNDAALGLADARKAESEASANLQNVQAGIGGYAPRRPADPPNAGSFEDYIIRVAKAKGVDPASLTPADIEAGRKAYQQADDRPRINVNLPGSKLSPNQEANLVNKLSTQYDTLAKPARELQRQLKLMDVGLAAAKAGDMNAGQQAVLVTFQKILDPNSVVRESEYFRSAQGQSLLARMEGFMTRMEKGGAGFTPENLDQFANLARTAVHGYDDSLKASRARIGAVAERYGIPQEVILTDYGFDAPAAAEGDTSPGVDEGDLNFERNLQAGGQAPTPAQAPAETKMINGFPYTKVQGGWQRVKQ